VTLVPNGVDTAAYRVPHDRPCDLPVGAVAVYVGTLHGDRLDVDLCASTSEALDGLGQLVLVGPDALAAQERSRLEAAGVVMLGARSSEAVPAYVQHADVLVVPHVVTPFTDSLDPIKLYEYLAGRRPVVSTPVAGFRDVDDDLVVITEPDSFAHEVAAALREPRRPAEAAVPGRAALSDWARRVDDVEHVLERLRSREADA
jgi:glycosyltransferase involved in cell wall biosynthesis